jgi:hypothetical protein
VGWLAIVDYGDFYDVPHCIVVEREGVLYVFDCPFDDELDDYGADYDLLRLPDSARHLAATRFAPWERVLRLGHRVGSVPVAAVRFDDTRRRAIDDSVFDLI